jgi:hypothetical protein
MNIRRIIREEIGDFDWISDIDGYLKNSKD